MVVQPYTYSTDYMKQFHTICAYRLIDHQNPKNLVPQYTTIPVIYTTSNKRLLTILKNYEWVIGKIEAVEKKTYAEKL